MASMQDLLKKTLISNVIDFLSCEINKSGLSEERKESVEVAIQCLETAYELDSESRDKLDKVDLLNVIKGTQKREPTPEELAEAETYKNSGNNAMKQGKYEEAVTEYSKAINLNPLNAVYYCNRAAAYSRLERQHDAIKDCKEAIRLDSTYGKAYGRLGIAYSNLNMYNEAKEAYAMALKYDPSNTMYEANMAIAQERLAETTSQNSTNNSAGPSANRQLDLSRFLNINNESFINMAREMMHNPEFHNIMSGLMNMGESGDTNFEALFEAGQNLASRMQDSDPGFVENLRRSFEQPPGPGGDASNAAPPKKPEGSEDS